MDWQVDPSETAGSALDKNSAARREAADHTAMDGTASNLLPLVYEQLRQLAHRAMLAERVDQTLEATALVHEAYLRLATSQPTVAWAGPWHFYAAAAEAMRRVLIDRARARNRFKRGGALRRLELGEAGVIVDENESSDVDVVALDEALTRLSEIHPEKARLVKLRYFAGLTIQEASEAMGISVSTAVRYWTYARAWLYREIMCV